MKTLHKIHILAIAIFSILAQSCTNLDEKIYSTIPADEFFKNEDEMIMNVGRAYTHLTSYLNHWNIWGTLVITSDEGLCPYRETNLWWDNGVWIDLHRHNFHSQSGNLNNCWSFIFDGVTLCNQILYQMEESEVDFPTKKNLVAEVKILRAWLYLNAIDMYGNVPLAIDFKEKELPDQVGRPALFEFIESEIKGNIDLLDEVPAANNYGRVTQAMAYTMLSKLYLNAKEWIGKEMWRETSDACDKVIGYTGAGRWDGFKFQYDPSLWRVTWSLGGNFYWPRFNTQFTLKAEQYLLKEKGIKFDMIRHFRYCSIGFYAMKAEHAKANGGFRFQVALPPYKYKRKGYVPRVNTSTNMGISYNAGNERYYYKEYKAEASDNMMEENSFNPYFIKSELLNF